LPTSCADDLSGAFAVALESDVATALGLLRVFASGHERLDIVDATRLAERCAAHWRQAGGAALLAERPIAVELRVLWAVWSTALPGLDTLLGYGPLADACTAMGADHPHWVRLWHTLAVAYPGYQAPLQIGLAWIRDPHNFAAPYWSILWESLLDADWSEDQEGQAVRTSLIALGRDWLRGRESLPDWSYVWERLVQSDRLEPGWLAGLLRQGVDWGIGREETPGWPFVWERLVEHREALPDDIDAERLFRTGAEWLDGREDEPGWSFVWERLVEHREALPDDIDAEDLLRAGARWAQRHPDHRYVPTLMMKLLTIAPRYAEWLDELAGRLAHWLGEHASTLGGAQVIRTLAKQDFGFDLPRGSEVAGPGWMYLIEVL
jgi:hypothetical protein